MASQLILPTIFWLIGFYLMWSIPSFAEKDQVGDGSAPDGWPSVSVIVPARNEEQRIPRLLRSLADQTRGPDEIIVVDDCSSDHTARVARSMGAAVLRGKVLPSGWTGKPWACWQGVQHATGRILVFLDADTWLEQDGLARIVEEHRRKGGLLGVQPYHVTCKPYEQLSAFFNMILMASTNAFTPHGESLPPVVAFGACLVCSREDYLAVGGHQHEAVRGVVLEDIALARIFRAQGFPVSARGGRGAVSFRMYPQGLAQLIEGWSKSFASGAFSIRFAFLVLNVAWVAGFFSASIAPLEAFLAPGSSHIVVAALFHCLYALQMWWVLRRIGRFRKWAIVFFPVPLFFFGIVMLRSVILIHVLRRVTWRGRSIETTGRGAAR